MWNYDRLKDQVKAGALLTTLFGGTLTYLVSKIPASAEKPDSALDNVPAYVEGKPLSAPQEIAQEDSSRMSRAEMLKERSSFSQTR